MRTPWACPCCHGSLAESLRCPVCGRLWESQRGFAWLVDDAEVVGSDRLMRRVYHYGAALHDPLLAATFRVFLGSSVAEARQTILDRLATRPGDRVLEVGTGTGGNALRLVSQGVDYVGLDLAAGMLKIARRRLDLAGYRHVPLGIADAHALPLPDHAFDRVLHVGAVSSFRDPARAIAEMVRVAKPGATLVLVDEQLASNAKRTTRWAFAASTLYATRGRCRPPEAIPGAEILGVERLTDFFYLIRAEVLPRPDHTPAPAWAPLGQPKAAC